MSLQELCFENIAISIKNSPPLIQEMVLGQTTEIIKKQIKEEIRDEIKKEVKDKIIKKVNNNLKNEISQAFELLVPDIVRDILQSNNSGRMRTNFRTRYWDMDQQLLESIIASAEDIAANCITNVYIPINTLNGYSSDEAVYDNGDY
jgi:polyribonucleotide nucleotidyltransferase